MLRQTSLHELWQTRVPSYAVGPHGYLSLPYLIRLLQEAAMRNTVKLEISTPDLVRSHGVSWVLRRQQITCQRWPRLEDQVAILTAPTGFAKRLLTYRDFHLLDEQGGAIVSAVSEWVLINLKTRRLQPIPEHIALLAHDFAPASAHLNRPEGKLSPPPQEALSSRTSSVSYSMLDFNDHLTNPVFPALMLEPLGHDFLSEHLPYFIDIQFQAEARYAEEVTATAAPLSGLNYRHALYREDTRLALMETKWKALID